MSVIKTDFGVLQNGTKASLYTISNDKLSVSISDFGCAIQSIVFTNEIGVKTDVALGYDDVIAYQNQTTYFGITAGRYANRIANGRFCLNKKEYQLCKNDNGACHLHGGEIGFGKRMWQAEIMQNSLIFTLTSEDGDEGYPAQVKIKATYTIVNETTLSIEYTATTTDDTILNLTNHSYFNLNGEGSGSILNHTLKIDADTVVIIDKDSIPTGELRKVNGTCFDFTTHKSVGKDITSKDIAQSIGYDHCYVLSSKNAAELIGDKSGITMNVTTTKPAIQLYCGNFLDGVVGKSKYNQYAGLCLETQYMPDSPNRAEFDDCVLKRGETYYHKTEFIFSHKNN